MTHPYASLKYRLLFASVVLLLVVVFAMPGAHAQQSREALVVVEKVKFSQQSQRVDAVGNARALHSVSLFPAVADRVTDVNITPGQAVKEGDILVQLDARRQRVAVERAQIQLADVQRTVERLTRSREQEAIPQSELDDAVTLSNLRRVELEEAETNLEDRKVRAPFDGVVGITDVQVGDRINEQTMITSIDDRRQLYIDFSAPEGALALLEQEPTLSVTPWQQVGNPVEARIVEIDSRLDSTNRTIRVRALIDNPEERFRPGTSFRVELSLSGESYAEIPEAALMWGPTSAYVWRAVRRDGNYVAERVEAQIKQRLRGRVLIDADLQPGQLIITEGVQSVRSGQVVTFDAPDEDAV
ncbi:MAG: efflux RND transporter periplasmic adaptor subunit [Idiomarina sp.]|nr:efflux RND transporter periplasmic adaptor subunit [Idiomarina sp.]